MSRLAFGTSVVLLCSGCAAEVFDCPTCALDPFEDAGTCEVGETPPEAMDCRELAEVAATLRRSGETTIEPFAGICNEGPWCPGGTLPWAWPTTTPVPGRCIATNTLVFWDTSRLACCGNPSATIAQAKCASIADCVVLGLEPKGPCLELSCDGTCAIVERPPGTLCPGGGCIWGRCLGKN